MAAQATIRSALFIAACFFGFTLTACDNPSGQNQKMPSQVVSKKITMEETGKQDKEPASKKAKSTSEDKGTDKNKKAESESNKQKKTQTSEKIQVSQSIPAYSAAGKINPFLPLIQAGNSEKEKEQKPKRQLTPLEKLDLSQLQLVAVVQATGDGGDDFAMVQEASGKGYIVQKGTYIGTNQGIVTRIEKEKIIIEESFTDFKGDEKTRQKEMKLHKQDNKE